MQQEFWQPKRTLAPWHTLIPSILQKWNANEVQVNNGSSLVINFSYNAIGNDIDHPISFEYLTERLGDMIMYLYNHFWKS